MNINETTTTYMSCISKRELDPYEKLGFAIIWQQLQDLDKGLKSVDETKRDSAMIRAKKFFVIESDWFSELCLDKWDGPRTLRQALKNFDEYGTVYKWKGDQNE